MLRRHRMESGNVQGYVVGSGYRRKQQRFLESPKIETKDIHPQLLGAGRAFSRGRPMEVPISGESRLVPDNASSQGSHIQ